MAADKSRCSQRVGPRPIIWLARGRLVVGNRSLLRAHGAYTPLYAPFPAHHAPNRA